METTPIADYFTEYIRGIRTKMLFDTLLSSVCKAANTEELFLFSALIGGIPKRRDEEKYRY